MCSSNHALNYFSPVLLLREYVWKLKFSIKVAWMEGTRNLIVNVR